MSEIDHVGLWNRCLEIIRDNVPEQTYKTWFLPIIPLKYEDKTLVVQVPSQFFYEFLEDKFVDLLRKTLYKVIGEGTKLMYNVMVDKSSRKTVDLESTQRTIIPQKQVMDKRIPQIPVPELDPHLNPEYNFETFIEGYSNKLSRSVAEAVALNPAKTIFNPLFLYGASGVGKTHLANAIGTKIKELYPEKRVLYVSAHLFQVQYTDSVRNNTTNDFINFYQTIDILIIDDIQEFAGVTKTQNTFFHIFNHLHQSNKQLVLTCDRPPVELVGMVSRLLTRFKWGLTAEVERPDYELRYDILMSKVRRDGLSISEEVIDYIARNVTDNVRDLEGVIVSLMVRSSVLKKEISIDMADQVLAASVKMTQKQITIDSIKEAVCGYYGLETSRLLERTRKREVVVARQMSMYLAKKYTTLSLAGIGDVLGKKDHATVLHACKTISEQVGVDKKLRSDLEEIEQRIQG